MSNYVYIRSEPQCWTVGFYDPDGNWHPDSDWASPAEAQGQVSLLNGDAAIIVKRMSARIDALEAQVAGIDEMCCEQFDRLWKHIGQAKRTLRQMDDEIWYDGSPVD